MVGSADRKIHPLRSRSGGDAFMYSRAGSAASGRRHCRPAGVFRGSPENRRIRELEPMVPEFVSGCAAASGASPSSGRQCRQKIRKEPCGFSLSKKVLTSWWTGKHAPPPLPPSPVSAKNQRFFGRGACKETIFALENEIFRREKSSRAHRTRRWARLKVREGCGPLELSGSFSTV